MPIQVVCSGCQASFRAKDELAGRRVKCPKCGGEIIVASAAVVEAEPALPQIVEAPKPAAAAAKPMAKAKCIGEPNQPASAPAAQQPFVTPQTPAPAKPAIAPVVEVAASSPFAFDLNAAPAKRKTSPAPTKKPVATPAAAAADDKPRKMPSPWLLAVVGVIVIALVGGGLFIFRGGDDKVEPVAAVAPKAATPVSPQPAVVVPPREEELADVVERLKTGVVLITLMDNKGDTLGLGTGFLINDKKHAVTNHHVIKGGARGTVRFSNGIITEIKSVVAVDKPRDLAIVELDFVPEQAVPLKLTADANLRQGTKVVAIGHPRGLDYSVTEGIISALRTTVELPENAREFLEAPDNQQWIQTTAAISGGNSGGPLMLPDGRVVGINTWVAGGENLGFAGHVRHILDLTAKGAGAARQTLAEYSKSEGGLERAVVDEIDAFAVGYGEILEQAEAGDWQVDDEESAKLVLQAAAGTTFSRSNGLMTQELAEFGKRLAARSWDAERHVRKLNAFSVKMLEQQTAPVIFFAKVVSVERRASNRFRVHMAGRGIELDVVENYDAKDPKRVGDQLLVMGVRPPSGSGATQTVVSGLVTKVKYPTMPAEAARTEAADYVKSKRNLEKVPELLAAPECKLPQVLFAESQAKQQVYPLALNSAGEGFDAVRIPASARGKADDMYFMFTAPPGKVAKWGVSSIDGLVPDGVVRYLRIDNYQPDNLELPERNETYFVFLSGVELQNSKRHLLWFQLVDEDPVEVKLTGVYKAKLPAAPVAAEIIKSVGTTPTDCLEVTQKQEVFSTLPVAGKPDPDNGRATVEGTPL
jgi:predicted Zn finger-like uncharacterized protein